LLALAIPGQGARIETIGAVYVLARYGSHPPPVSAADAIDEAWATLAAEEEGAAIARLQDRG
jgi:hypothetical protein